MRAPLGMRIFIYEFVTGGGWYRISRDDLPARSLLNEARAMLQAVATDFAALPACEVTVLRDVRIAPFELPTNVHVRDVTGAGDEQPIQDSAITESDYVLLIAPEFDQQLLTLAEKVEHFGIKLLSPQAQFVAMASNKWQWHCFLRRRRALVPVAMSVLLPHGQPLQPAFSFPTVAKPVDGCGSIGLQLLPPGTTDVDWTDISGDAILQPHHAGTAASVAVLCGPDDFYCLATCEQFISDDGRFRYFGGACPLAEPLDRRANHLARRAIEIMPPTVGYVGVDLVLGNADDGSQDYVIEINPRLTTSYVGLRVLSETNLAQAMLDVTAGREPALSWKPGSVRWSADGVVDYLGP